MLIIVVVTETSNVILYCCSYLVGCWCIHRYAIRENGKMRKSILMGTSKDVINRRRKQDDSLSVSHCPSIGAYPSVVIPMKPVRRIVTFNHPCLMDSQ